MLTEKDLKEMELTAPKYDFVEPEKGAEVVSPIKRQIAKIQETALTFTLYDVYKNLGQLDKLIADKQAEIKGHEDMKKLFQAELDLIEKYLNITDLQKQYDVEVAIEIAIAEALKVEVKDVKPNETNS